MTSVTYTFMGHRLLLKADGGQLVECEWIGLEFEETDEPHGGNADKAVNADISVLHEAVTQLEEYLQGVRRQFSVPVRLQGTVFQKRVWEALCEIPYGTVVTYGELARRIGKPTASRAVARACGANHIDVIVPCHRVVAADGSAGGYNGPDGLKDALLAIEGVVMNGSD